MKLERYCQIGALVVITIAIFKPTSYPRRLWLSDLLYLAPVLLFAFFDDRYYIHVGLPSIIAWSFLYLVLFSLVFAIVTANVAWIFNPGRKRDLNCSKCGYSLVGLDRPRCPECGTSFSSELLTELLNKHEN